MVCGKSEVDPNTLYLSFSRRNKRSTHVNLVGSLMDNNDRVSNVICRNFKHLISNGLHLDFWTDNWKGRREMKMLFPRIYALATVKQRQVSLFSHWNEGIRIWNVHL